MKKLNNEELLAELEVFFPVDQVLWRVTNTANNRTRGQVVPYADPRAYTDRLNARVLSATLHDFGSPRLLTSISRAARD